MKRPLLLYLIVSPVGSPSISSYDEPGAVGLSVASVDPPTGLRVEEVQPVHVDDELDRLSLPHVRPRVQTSEELDSPAIAPRSTASTAFGADVVRELLRVLGHHRRRLDHEVHEHVGPERLAEEHGRA